MLIDESEFDSQKNQKFLTNVKRFNNVYRDCNDNKSRFKKWTYVINENEKKNINEIKKKFHEVDNNVYYNKNLKYYYSNNNNENIKFELSIYFVVFLLVTFVCRRYNKQFVFNNRLYLYLRINCFRIQKSFVNVDNIKNFFVNAFVYFTKFFSINITKVFSNKKLFVIRFNVNAFKNVNINYNFRNWNYAKTKILFIENKKKENVVLNIDANIFLKNENFVKRQNVDLLIRKMIFLLMYEI